MIYPTTAHKPKFQLNPLSKSKFLSSAGLRRIEAVTGKGAEAFIERRLSDLEEIAEYLNSELDEVSDKVQSFIKQLTWERRQRQILESVLAERDAESLVNIQPQRGWLWNNPWKGIIYLAT